MGFFIFGAMAVGFMVGCVGSIVGILVALGPAKLLSKSRKHVPLVFTLSGLGIAALIVLGVYHGLLPLEETRPGNDYDIVMMNGLISSVVVGASLGMGALGAVAVARFCPRRDEATDD